MHPEEHRVRIRRQIRPPQRTLDSLDFHSRSINNCVSHAHSHILNFQNRPLSGPDPSSPPNGSRSGNRIPRTASCRPRSPFIMRTASVVPELRFP
jgi:hypothetical protein